MYTNKYFAILIFIIKTLILFPLCNSAGTIDKNSYAEKIKVIERYVKENMSSLKIPGLAIAFYKDDFKWSKGFGYADIENRVPVTPETLFRMASITKPMTALAILKLAEDGKVNLNERVQKYVPFFPKKKWPLSIIHLLGHLGGISHYRDNSVDKITEYHTTRQSIDIFKDWKLKAEPGTKYIYSSYGYNLLGAVIEGASDQSYADYMTENVWKPLGMNRTRMDIGDEIIVNRSRGYNLKNGVLKNSKYVDISSRFASGGTISTVLDLLRFSKGLDSGKVISLKAQKKMYKSLQTSDGRDTGYAMGWRTNYTSGNWNIYHSGRQSGTSTYLLRFPKMNFAVAVASNSKSTNTAQFARLVQKVVLNVFEVDVEFSNTSDNKNNFKKIHKVWNYGLGYLVQITLFEKVDPADLHSCFNYFNSIDSNDKDAKQKIKDGVFKNSGRAFLKIGVFMARALKCVYGKKKLDKYREMGPTEFFRDYINLYKRGNTIRRDYQFTKKMEMEVNRWNRSWQNVWTEEIKSYLCFPKTDLFKIQKRLRNLFRAKSIYPDFDITDYAGDIYYGAMDFDKAVSLAEMAVYIYPKLINRYSILGSFLINRNQINKALKTYQKAYTLDKKNRSIGRYISWLKYANNGYKELKKISPEVLKNYAGDFKSRHISYKNSRLYYNRNGGVKKRLVSLSKYDFAIQNVPGFRIRFVKDKDNRIYKIIGMYISGFMSESLRDNSSN